MLKLSRYLKKKLVIKLKINDIKHINDRYILKIYVKNEKCQEAITGFTLVLTDVPQIYIIKLSKQMKWGKAQ